MTLDPSSGMLPIGTVLDDRYRILRLVAEGGMSIVYEVEDARLPGRLVLKQMREMAPDPVARAHVAEQFRREAETLARLSHPNLPRVTDSFAWQGGRFLVEELVEGHTLETLMEQQSPRDEAEVVEWGRQVCRALAYLHAEGVVYRDLKPSNLMLTPEGTIRLIDFGIVRAHTLGKTRDTVVMGTPGFAAPEQYGTEQTDPRSDLYSLGVLLHHLLSGHDPAATPFALPTVRELNPLVSDRMEMVILRAVDLRPERRFQSAEDMLEILGGVEPIRLEGERFTYVTPDEQPLQHAGAGLACLATCVVSALLLPATPNMGCAGLLFGALWLWMLTRSWRSRRAAHSGEIRVDSNGIVLETGGLPQAVRWRDLDEVSFEDRNLWLSRCMVLRAARTAAVLPIAPPRVLAEMTDEPYVKDADRLVRIVMSHAPLEADPGGKRYRRRA